MLDTSTMLGILTTITLNDYYTDQIEEKRQKFHSYTVSKSHFAYLLSNLVQAGIIEPVSGYGKGKYRFIKR